MARETETIKSDRVISERHSLTCFCAISILILLIAALLGQEARCESRSDSVRVRIKHAETYYWFGMGEKGNMESFRMGLSYLDKAEVSLKALPLPKGEVASLKREIEALRLDFEKQMEVHHDTLFGVFPLIRLLTPSLFADALATGTFELIDDPAVMASTAAAYRLSGNVFQKWSSRPQLHVVFNSIPQNKALENEALYIFNATANFFVHNYREVTTILTPAQREQFHRANVTPGIKERLCDAFGISNLLVVTIRQADVVNGDYFYVVEGEIYNREKDAPLYSFCNMGYSRDRNARFWPIIVSNIVLLVLSVILFAFLLWIRNSRLPHLTIIFAASVTCFLIGRVMPWILIPLLSSFAPKPETLALLSFWWPCLMGAALFLAPTVLYRIVSVRIQFLTKVLDTNGRGGATSVGIAMGACAYLAGPLFLFLETDALKIMIPLVICSGVALYIFGRALDAVDPLPARNIWIPVILLLGLGPAFTHLDEKYLWFCTGVILLSIVFANLRAGAKRVDTLKDKHPLLIDDIPSDTFELIKRTDNPPYQKLEIFHEAFRIVSPLIEGKTAWLSLIGPPGVGKTATASAVIHALRMELYERGEKIIILQGECPERDSPDGGEGSPYTPFQKALARYFDVNVLAEPEKQIQIIDSALDGIFESVVPLASLFFPTTGDVSNPASSKREIFFSVARTIQKLAEKQTVVLFFDDIHWMDNASRELLSYLLNRFSPGSRNRLLILLTSRTHEEFVTDKEKAVLSMEMPVKEQRREILASSLGLRNEVAETIVEKVGVVTADKGGLFWLFRVAGDLAEKGLFQRTDDGFAWSDEYKGPGNLPIPGDFRTSLEAEIKNIPEYRSVLTCAACLGLEFSATILAKGLKIPRFELLQILDRIESETGIVFDDQRSDDIYSFHSPFMLECIRQMFSISGRGPKCRDVPQIIREYHAGLAGALEKTLEQSSNKLYEVANHYYAAGLSGAEKAQEYSLKVAHAARSGYLFTLAREYLDMAHECRETLGHDADLDNQYLLVDCDEAHVQGIHKTDTAVKGMEYLKDHMDVPFEILASVARACYEAGNPGNREDPFSAECVSIGRLMVDSFESSVEKAEGYHFMGIGLPKREKEERIKNLQEGIHLLETLPEEDLFAQALLGRILNSLAEELSYPPMKDGEKAGDLFKRSLTIKERPQLRDIPGLARSHGGLGRLAMSSDPTDIPLASHHFLEDLKYSERIEDITGQSMMYSLLGACDSLEGNFKGAMENYQKSHQYAESPRNKFFALAGLLKSAHEERHMEVFADAGKELLALATENAPMPEPCAKTIVEILENCKIPIDEKWSEELLKQARESLNS